MRRSKAIELIIGLPMLRMKSLSKKITLFSLLLTLNTIRLMQDQPEFKDLKL
jgi:hypothetical protein